MTLRPGWWILMGLAFALFVVGTVPSLVSAACAAAFIRASP